VADKALSETREFHVSRNRGYSTASPTRWIIAHSLQYWWLPPAMVLTAVINNFAYGNVPLFIGRGFDVVRTPGWEWQSLVRVAAVVGLSAVVQGLTGLLRNLATEFLAHRVERDAREELYTALLGKSQTYHAAQRTGDIMARATNDMRAVNLLFSPGLLLIIDSSFALIIPLAMILAIDPALWPVPVIFTAILVITVRNYNQRLKPVSIAQREEFGRMNAVLADAIGGIEVVKSNVQERYELDRFLGRAGAFRDHFVRQGEVQARYWPMMVFALCWGAALVHGLWLWRAEVLSLGEVVSFMGLFATFRFTTFISIFSFNLVQLGLASAERILTLIRPSIGLNQPLEGRRERIDGRIEVDGVSFSFVDEDNNAAEPVLRDVSFTADPGETVAIVGRTGSGKSTLARLINRIFDTDSGAVRIDGVDVRHWDLESLRSQISVIEQDVFLFSLSIRDNIAFGRPDASHEEIVTAARQAQAHDFITSFRAGYDTMIGERGVTLSGGQKQRLAIARAFLTDPRILILDDSTSAIDSRTEDEIQQAMNRIASDRTTILITHRLSQIRRADRIVLLQRGGVLDTGTHEQLLDRCADYRRIFAHACPGCREAF
jgi:ATP-binding cassette, subfamily B, bacterial